MTNTTAMNGKWSGWTIIGIMLCVLAYRIHTLVPNELAWDAFGYYLYLPATFIHHDPLLLDVGWVHQVMAERPISSTLYQLAEAPNGGVAYFFLMGMSLLYMPFFLIGHGIAWITGQPTDGFSLPYQYSIALGFVVYTAIALVHLRRILLAFFNDRLVAWLVVIVAIGTNWFHFVTMKNLETANAIFMLMTVLVWNTLQWHRTGARRNILWVALSLALITLVKPSEVLAILVPLLWGVHDGASLKAKWKFVVKQGGQVLLAVAVGLLVMAPQMIYWKMAVGSWIYDSYKNPGIGLDPWSPHFVEAFFSYRKGWLVYTPIMAFALIGFVHLYRRNKALFPVILVWFIASTWVVVSWTEWWYGASFGPRPMMTSYILLALPLGYCVQAIAERGTVMRNVGYGIMGLLIGLNLFQMWQHHNGVLDPYNTSKAYYWATFGRTSVPEGAEKLKLPARPFTQDHVFSDRENYRKVVVGTMDFEAPMADHPERQERDSLAASTVLRMDGEFPYTAPITSTYGALTTADYAWIHARMRLFVPVGFEGEMPCLVFSMDRPEGSYGYKTQCPDPAVITKGQWNEVSFDFMLPPVRSGNDELKCYAWCRSKSAALVDDLELDIYLPKAEQ